MHKTLTQSHGHATHWVPGGHIDVLHTLFPGGQCGGFAQYWLHPTSMIGAIQKKKCSSQSSTVKNCTGLRDLAPVLFLLPLSMANKQNKTADVFLQRIR